MSILTPKKLTAQIAAISRASEKFAEVVQETLISCAYYAMKDGNTTPFNDLLDAVGNGTRIKGLTAWAELFAPVHIKDERFALSKGAAKGFHINDEEDFAEHEATMRAGPRWDKIVAKESVESIWDTAKYLDRVFSKLDKQGEHGLMQALRDAELAYRIKLNGPLESEHSAEVLALPAPKVA